MTGHAFLIQQQGLGGVTRVCSGRRGFHLTYGVLGDNYDDMAEWELVW